MSRRTGDVSSRRSCYTTDLRQAIRQYLPRSGLALVVDDQKLRWVPRMLVTCAILLTWDLAELMTDGFARARQVVVGDVPRSRRAAVGRELRRVHGDPGASQAPLTWRMIVPQLREARAPTCPALRALADRSAGGGGWRRRRVVGWPLALTARSSSVR